MNDIESFTYITQAIKDLPFKHLPLKAGIENNDYLEDLLLIKGWRMYNWQKLINAKVSDSLTGKKSLEIDGVLFKNTYPVNKVTQINLLADTSLRIITTNSKGYFKLNSEDIAERPQKFVKLFMNNENETAYSFKLNDQFKLMHENLASKLGFINYEDSIKSFNTREMLLKKDETGNQLQEVIVKTKVKKENDYLNFGKSILNVNECGDYVCKNNILNCIEHSSDPENRPPIIGEKYRNLLFRGQFMSYKGCVEKKINSNSFILNGVYFSREFYQTDNVSPLISEPEYISTLYWNPLVFINSITPFKITFKTGFIPGKFKIIVQGRTNDDVIYQESFITVGHK
jgi:hypothetical protein